MKEFTFSLPLGAEEGELERKAERKFGKPLAHFRIVKKSLDARDKANIRYVYTVEVSDKKVSPVRPVFPQAKKEGRVYIAGAGPAGLFCALRLLDHGIRPILVERGKRVEERILDVEKFLGGGEFSKESNVQFGEGGAGTFSDGKLFTQTNSPLNRDVIATFLRFGAPAEIGYESKPHIGTDKLRSVVSAMREEILSRGGEIRFSSKVEDVILRDGKLCAVEIDGVREDADELVLAIGHSARDTFEMLLSRGFAIEQKEFAAGVRVEHLQEKISFAQYGKAFSVLPPADYKLVSHAGERAVFTFCMCPGGVVIPSASEEGGVVVNGMSEYARGEKNANAAIVAQIRREDFGSDHPLAGVELQRRMERAAYLAGGGDYRAPVQRTDDFLNGKESSGFSEVVPSYARGTAFAPLESYLPAVAVRSIRDALPDFGRKIKGFDREGLFTGVESRTSSPVRIVRDENLQAIGKEGVYPCGEGCGYAGGITSAAADGIRVAESIARKYL